MLAVNAVAFFRFRKLPQPLPVDVGTRTWESAFDEPQKYPSRV